VTEALASLPVPLLAAALWSFALVRGAGYYLLGRISRGRPGGRLDAWVERATRGRIHEAEAAMADVGSRAIVLAYPLYGVSAGTQIVAGGLQMGLARFYLALGAVSLPWATMQAVIGIAAFRALVMGYAPWVALAVAVLAAGWLVRRRRRRRGRERAPLPAGDR
jgi:membrane protein DedA with SNARE-associated domain